ncbi:unnamed protein product [Allacma fusca]|uniref:Uncharacterized protein n=1 Tax=Allacma fusca TaxID=39272 RepID=A0A8J2NTS6_9HEXA|nr:unnamed protein product [Allacma fusca]
MGAPAIIFKMFCVVSAVLGLIVLVMSCIYLVKVAKVDSHTYNDVLSRCDNKLLPAQEDVCRDQRTRVIGAGFAVFISIIQIIYAIVSLVGEFDHHNCYGIAHIIFAIFYFIAFICNAVADQGFRENKVMGITIDSEAKDISIAHATFLFFNFVFCIASTVVMCVLACAAS